MSKRPWTFVEIDMLRRAYPDTVTAVLANTLGRPLKSVYQKAKELGIRKSDTFLASQASGRLHRGGQTPAMVANQFKPGQQPWNKGSKGKVGLHPNSRRTQFKKGEMSGAAQHNYVPIGSYRITADGLLERKMADDPSVYPARRWTPVSRLVWEAAHGPIPDGFIVVFKPGLKTAVCEEITLERLECISRAENARRNHWTKKNPELGSLFQLKGAITRQVNRIKKQQEQSTP